MQPLFPDLDQVPKLPDARWCRSTATLGADRRVLSVQVDLISVDGTLLGSRAYYPAPGQTGSLDVFGRMMAQAFELTTD